MSNNSMALVLVTIFAGATGCGSEGLGEDSAASPSAGVESINSELRLGATGSEVHALNEYLKSFGYFPNEDLRRRYPAWRPLVATPPARNDVFDSNTETAVRALQLNFGLPKTGVVDDATREILKTARCGVPDGIASFDGSEKWDLLDAGTWGKNNLTWKVLNTDGDLPISTVESWVAWAFAEWSKSIGHTFSKAVGSAVADIQIDFKPMSTWPGNPSAGTGAIALGGDVELNSDRSWSVTLPAPPTGTLDMPSVLMHEFGHALGLGHSAFSDSIMWGSLGEGSGGVRRTTTIDDRIGSLAMYPRWTMFDDPPLFEPDTDIAYNERPDGSSSTWIIGGAFVTGGQQIWRLNNRSDWSLMPGGAVRIAVNSPTDRPWIIDSAGTIKRLTTSNTWSTVPGCAKDIGVGSDDSVWIIGCTPRAGGFTIHKFKGVASCASSAACWAQIPGGATRISVGPNVPGGPIVPWIINASNHPFRRSSAAIGSGSWQQLPGTVIDIAATGGYAWAIGTQLGANGGNNIQAWNEQSTAGGSELREDWVTVAGGGLAIAATPLGHPLVVSGFGDAHWTF